MQTTRIFAPWHDEASPSDRDTWHEIARPQVHGHDINSVTIIKGKGNHRYVSGADEKVARVFESPLSFLKTLNAISQTSFAEDLQAGVQVLGANMSALGLSQKPIYVHRNSLSQSLSQWAKVMNNIVIFVMQRNKTSLTEQRVVRALTQSKLFLMRSQLF